jgi:ribosomal protein L11 methyltransferase
MTSDSHTAVAVLETDQSSALNVADLITESFASDDVAVSLVDNGAGRWRVAIHFCAALDETAVRELVATAAGEDAASALRFERVAATDWVRESLAGLPPVTAGRFVVHGAHDRTKIPGNRIGIEIEAALAFGTGHHGTTRGCLLALNGICKQRKRRRASVHRHPEVRAKRASKDAGPSARAVALRGSALRAEHLRVTGQRILDVGTGSGVLAIAAARALHQRVLATDIDASAVRVARANAAFNRAGGFVEIITADGVAGRRIRERAPYDLIFANVLLKPLQRFAAPLTRLTAPGAYVVLSGLLPSQANAAIAAYHRLALQRRIEIDGWTTLILRRH